MKADISKSTFDPGPTEQRLTITVAPDGRFAADGIDGGGKAIHWSHAFGNGKEVPVDGLPGVTDVTIVHGRETQETFSRDGKAIVKVESVLSPPMARRRPLEVPESIREVVKYISSKYS
jgi:hypothetical protein